MIARTTWVCLVIAMLAGPGCCKCGEEPPPIFSATSGDEADDEASGGATAQPAPAPRGVTEGRAVEIAMNTAVEQGVDIDGFDDIVVHGTSDGRSWEVQLRRPRILRYYVITIDKQSGSAALEERMQ
ncbi:MAG: hypothetical protein KF901_08910 [Myxococcales bacterium]|nr:hypothetical protein [Myxococcales bacterium]